ncbi:MAG: hypothetical protein K1W41_20145, partial [Lachnospiraceae bacterium]
SDFGVTGEDVRVGNCKYLLNQQTLSMSLTSLRSCGKILFLLRSLSHLESLLKYQVFILAKFFNLFTTEEFLLLFQE